MTERPLDRESFDEPGQPSGDPLAGAANTPPFEPSRSGETGGRPPSHREHGGEEGVSTGRMEGIAPAPETTRGESPMDRARDRMSETVDRAADRLESAANRVRDTAGEYEGESGVRGRAARWADEAADAGEDAADFLRDAGVDDLRALVERQVRERPLQSLLLAAATGWLVGKILR